MEDQGSKSYVTVLLVEKKNDKDMEERLLEYLQEKLVKEMEKKEEVGSKRSMKMEDNRSKKVELSANLNKVMVERMKLSLVGFSWFAMTWLHFA